MKSQIRYQGLNSAKRLSFVILSTFLFLGTSNAFGLSCVCNSDGSLNTMYNGRYSTVAYHKDYAECETARENSNLCRANSRGGYVCGHDIGPLGGDHGMYINQVYIFKDWANRWGMIYHNTIAKGLNVSIEQCNNIALDIGT